MSVSVVIASCGSDERLWATLNSIWSQLSDVNAAGEPRRSTDLGKRVGHAECIIVHDGPMLPAYSASLRNWIDHHPSCSLVVQEQAGLTRALIRGCQVAQGQFLARIDVGDEMLPGRLCKQLGVFAENPDCVLVTSNVEVCGPRWEPLRIERRLEPMRQPIRVDTVSPERGIAIDIPHHASVMFRRSAYEAVGGYRPQFYFGQDWDLWYRLASQGTFFHIPDVLTRVRLFTGGLSSRHWREQRAIAELSLACHVARSRGESEEPLLQASSEIRPRPQSPRQPLFDGMRAEGAYFIAESLRRNRDCRCRRYFLEALRHGFWKPRIWLRAFQSLAMGIGSANLL